MDRSLNGCPPRLCMGPDATSYCLVALPITIQCPSQPSSQLGSRLG